MARAVSGNSSTTFLIWRALTSRVASTARASWSPSPPTLASTFGAAFPAAAGLPRAAAPPLAAPPALASSAAAARASLSCLSGATAAASRSSGSASPAISEAFW